MWPFDSGKVKKLVAEALAPGALPSARKKAIEALMALPQEARSLECYCRIALDAKQVWDTRYKALDAMKLSPNADGARALLRCVASDLRRPALQLLAAGGMPAALRESHTEWAPVLTAAMEQISQEAETDFSELLLTDLEAMHRLLTQIDAPAARTLASRLDPIWFRARNRQVQDHLRRALTSGFFFDVEKAVEALRRLDTPEANAALAEFHAGESRLVEKIVIGGVGAPEERIVRQVYTSELGQKPCPTERARKEAERQAASLASASRPLPPSEAPPALEDVPTFKADLAQDYVAASARGIEVELLDLLGQQLPLFQTLHLAGSLAPLAAFLDAKGEIDGMAFTSGDADTAEMTVEQAIDAFRHQFRALAPTGRIVATAIFYHGCHGLGRGDAQVAAARNPEEADCIVARLDHDSGQAVTAVIQYVAEVGGAWRYAPVYYALRTPDIFLDRDYQPLLPDRVGALRLPRRPAQLSDQGTHPELMLLLETQMGFLRELMSAGSMAPVAAALKPSGEIQGFILFNRDVWDSNHLATDVRDSVVVYPVGDGEQTADGAVRFFIRLLRAEAEKGAVVASAIFFHGLYTTPAAAALGIRPGAIGERPNCLVAMLDHRLSQSKSVVQRYERLAEGWKFMPAEHYSAFPSIFHETETSFLDPLAS